MYIEHLRNEFYDELLLSRPLIIAAADVDSVCAVKILQELFKLDGISYTLVSVDGYSDIKTLFNEFKDTVQHVILINCGGTIDILGHLDNPVGVTFYIIDSHRPTHVLNIYDDTQQVKIVTPPGENEDIPAFDDIFRYDDDNIDSNGEDDESESDSEAVNGDEQRVRKRQRIEWNKQRRRLLFEYTQYSYYGPPASIIMLEVAWTMNRGGHDLVWYAIVGLTDYFALSKMDRANYVLLADQLHSHVSRLKHSQPSQRDTIKLEFENDICLHLYRHWNLYESLTASPYFAVHFKFWLGENQLDRFLLDVGLPLNQCKQRFSAMELYTRKHFKEMIKKKADKWNLQDITIPSFTRQMGLKRKYGALDCHLAILASLELSTESSLSDRFKAALDTLPLEAMEQLDKGIEHAKMLLKSILQQVQTFLNTHTRSIKNLGPFLLAVVSLGTISASTFASPNILTLLSRFTLMAFVEFSGSRKASHLPLVMIVEQSEDVSVVMGMPPLAADTTSNLFGKVFERVAESLEDAMFMNYFDSHIAQIKTDHKKAFVDRLLEIME